jgi:hypothetical protein
VSSNHQTASSDPIEVCSSIQKRVFRQRGYMLLCFGAFHQTEYRVLLCVCESFPPNRIRESYFVQENVTHSLPHSLTHVPVGYVNGSDLGEISKKMKQ